MSTKVLKAFATKVKESWWVFTELNDDLRDRVIQYLIDGEDGTCLLELPAGLEHGKPFFRTQHDSPRAIDRVNGKKLLESFQIEGVPVGYYARLGDLVGRFPVTAKSGWVGGEDLPAWLVSIMQMRTILDQEQNYRWYQGNSAGKSNFSIGPVLHELELAQAIDAVISTTMEAAGQDTYNSIGRVLMSADGWKTVLDSHSKTVAEKLLVINADAKSRSLTWLVNSQMDLTAIASTICDLAIGSSKQVRSEAAALLVKMPEQAISPMAERLRGSGASEREHAASLLVLLAGDSCRADLEAALENEKAKRVREAIETALAGLIGLKESSNIDFDLPPIELPPSELPLPKPFIDALWKQMQAAYEKLEAQYQKALAQYNQPGRPKWMSKPDKFEELSQNDFDSLIEYIEGRGKKPSFKKNFARQAVHSMPNWSGWADLKSLHLIHVLRFLNAFDMLQLQRGHFYLFQETWLETHRDAQPTRYGLRELDAALNVMLNANDSLASKGYLTHNTRWSQFLNWEPDAIWPAFAERPELMCAMMLPGSPEATDDGRRNAIKVAAMMPHIPAEIEASLWAVALGESKTDRPMARKALLSASEATARSVAALNDGRQAVRIAAAEMLADLKNAEAVGPLKKALAKEKQELVKGSMLLAVESSGGDVEEFLGKRKQAIDAKKGLEKKLPKGMEWVPIDSLPIVRWADDGKPVAPEIVQWWVVQSIQFKLLNCGVILRRALAMCRPVDVSTLANFLLSTWIAHDTTVPTREDVIDEATKQAKMQFASYSWVAEHFKTEEKYCEKLIEQMRGNFLHSAINEKGLLAIVAGVGSIAGTKMAESVKMIERYIRTYHGQRLAQSKALLETLGWFEEPLAIQVLLSLANRFRTKGIQKRAAEIVQEIADREGWTMDELADRTIPDAGFTRKKDDQGNPIGDRAELVLDYGSRKFCVILGDALDAVITRDDGKPVKALPAAAKDDDAELVKVAKKEFTSAKKTVKEVVKRQAERLYEAACIQRAWPADQWQRFLASHPIAGALCRRVVWAAGGESADAPAVLFRPMEDGSLTDVNDDEFKLPEDAYVRVAHSSLLDDATVKAWKQHLMDYEVPELFKQFGRPTYRLPESREKETEVADFKGHMLTTYKLRSKATKLGWVRGEAEDGGSFCIYRKSFPSEGVMAIIEFTGSYLPEADLPAGLKTLYFMPWNPKSEAAYSWYGTKTLLSKVPAVLLSECYNDMRDIAADGSGFDAEWEKKGLY